MTKVCATCKLEQPAADFPRDRRAKGGLSRLCRACVSIRNAAYAKAHIDNPPTIPATKRCPQCGLTKPSEDYHRNRRRPDGLLFYCKACWAARARREKYGLSDEEYQQKLVDQGGQCAICLKVIDLVVDHCHTSKKVRDLLCVNCNTAIGQFQEDVTIMERAIEYMKRWDTRASR